MSEAKQKADEAKLNAYDVLMKTNRTKQRVDQSNEELRGLIKQIRDFLTRTSPCVFCKKINKKYIFVKKRRKKNPVFAVSEDAADLESIELVANEVLAMQMPTTPEQLQNLTDEIRQKVEELGGVESILQQSAGDIQRAEELLEEARRARSVVKPCLLNT